MRVAGIDEVGRGAWAGPLVAAAVILPDKYNLDGLADSKLLTPKKRERLSSAIKKCALDFGIGWVAAPEIDVHGLTRAVALAMSRAIEKIMSSYDEIIVDGNIDYLKMPRVSFALPKADRTHAPVSAASIIAKVARDDFMAKLASEFPQYGFDKNVGYGTKLHQTMLIRHGIIKGIHRESFRPVRSLL